MSVNFQTVNFEISLGVSCVFYVKYNSILTRAHSLYDVNRLKYIETCFMIQPPVCLGECPTYRGEKCVTCCWVEESINVTGARSACSFLHIFRILCLLALLIPQGNNISYYGRRFVCFPLQSCQVCVPYFEALLLGTITFRIVTTSDELGFVIVRNGPSLSPAGFFILV